MGWDMLSLLSPGLKKGINEINTTWWSHSAVWSYWDSGVDYAKKE
jgi:hypothetical protein